MASEGTTVRAPVAGAIISSDATLREELRSLLASRDSGVFIELEIPLSVTEIADPELEQLRQLEPGLVFLDLEENPHVSLKFAEYLIESTLAGALIGVGQDASQELLLAAMQAGVSEYLTKPVTSESLRSALERVWRKTGKKIEATRRAPGEVIAVFGAKGGSGSTTLCANLAIEIHRLTRKKTLLVDLDLELGETALLLGIEPEFSVVDLMRNFHRVDSGLLASYIQRHESGVELLSAPYEPADFESVSGDRVSRIMEFLKQHYDYVIVDAPKTFNPATQAAFREADEILLVATADLPSLRNLTRSMPLLRNLRGRKPLDQWLRLVLNRFETDAPIPVPEVERTLGMNVYWTLRNDYSTVMTSINEGKPVVSEAKSVFGKDVRGLAAEVTGVTLTKDSGFLKGLFSPFRSNGRHPHGARTRESGASAPEKTKVKADG